MKKPREQKDATKQYREVSRFSWTKVDESLIQRLLDRVYRDDGRQEDADALQHLSEEALRLCAKIALGQPPKAKFNHQLVDVILDEGWLDSAPAAVVKELAVMVQAGAGPEARMFVLDTKLSAAAFLSTRRRSRNVIANVRNTFVKIHKTRYLVEVKSRERTQRKGLTILEGKNEAPPFFPYQHQIEARKELNNWYTTKSKRKGGCLIVLPTGAGKTETIIEWLLERMEACPLSRVLWISHQQELLDQSIERFRRLSLCRSKSFVRRARSIHGNASDISTLNSSGLDVAAVSFQGLSKLLKSKKTSYISKFFERPVYVVIDEAHHAGARAFRNVVTDLLDRSPKALVGLTATPAPTSMANHYHLRELFPRIVYRANYEQLVARGILSRTVLSTVRTRLEVVLGDEELKLADTRDLPPEALRKLDRHVRNQLIVSTWTQQPNRWGKTLVFATRILHAETLGGMFSEAGVDVRTLHSMSENRRDVLNWFRTAKNPAVLISVGMLTEGVDLPDARTAFLARPTTSRVLMKQMVGRVLRGPRAGGESLAEIVYFDDTWTNFGEVLHPDEVLPMEYAPQDENAGKGKERTLPNVLVDDDENQLPSGIGSAIDRQIKRMVEKLDEEPPPYTLYSTRLIGYYELPDSMLPVFDHQKQSYKLLFTKLKQKAYYRRLDMDTLFEELHPPYPTKKSLLQVKSYHLEFGKPPPFHDFNATLGPQVAARKVLQAGAITVSERIDIIRHVWATTLARVFYPSLEGFEEAVDQELREQQHRKGRCDPEILVDENGERHRRNIPGSNRDLPPLVDRVLEQAERLLTHDKYELLSANVPPVAWTSRVVGSTFGHWSIALSGRNAGKQIIRINRLLRAPSSIIPDEVICFVIYHEMLHHLLPGQGHDAEFRDLEMLWPDAGQQMAFLSTLHERYSLNPSSYRR
jgi:superfamily II DNA or RNA helicase